jgi:hypothetical protein
MSRVRLYVLKILFVLLCFALTTSCAVKTGIQNLNGSHYPLSIDEEPLRYWEFEAFTPKLANEYMDFTLGIGYNSGQEKGKIEVHDHRWLPEIKTYMWDIHLGARLFPLGCSDRDVIPYVGGGLGYFEYDLERRESGDYEYVYSSDYYDYYILDTHNDTVAHGYYPYLSTGLFLPLDKKYSLQVEFRYDFDRDYKQYDMDGYLILVGIAFRYK